MLSILSFAQDKYEEDLSKVRPVFPMVEIELANVESVNFSTSVDTNQNVTESTDKIEEKLKELKSYYEGSSRTRGYRVQVFSGNNVRSAEKVQGELSAILSQELSDLTVPKVYNLYDAPLFRVKVGDYILKERAFYMLNLINKIEGYENSLLVPDLIDVKNID